ncbi:alpha/beta hydrolase [Oculatella sp. LEGE 06141]|nr:alpha/beta hydrolase [Oculatella sp. LEGE 06141]
MGLGFSAPGLAAERVAVRFGPIQYSVAVDDLEQYAETGEVPPSLQPVAPLLSEDVQQVLSSHLQLDPNLGDKIVEDLLHSSAGDRLLTVLQSTILDSSVEELKIALMRASREADGLSLLGLLRAYPDEVITIDMSSAIALASQLNLPYLQSQALTSILERELTVPGEPFRSDRDPAAPGEQWVRQQTLVFRDHDRDRSIPVDLYWSRQTHGPLVVISHGFGADRRFLGYLAYHLASHGITVAALEHPGSNVAWLTEGIAQTSNSRLGNLLPASEFIDRPKDISFLLNELHRLNQFSRTLRGKLNTEKVSVIGHSLGGYTALALAGAPLNLDHLRQFCDNPDLVTLSPADLLQCNASELPDHQIDLRDERVAQVVALNPVIGRLFDENSLAQIEVPTMILAGTDDSITPAVSQQFLPFMHLQMPKYLLTAIGATHLSVGDPANLNHSLTQSVFMRERRGEETEVLRSLLRGVSLAFVEQLTPNASEYAPFLSSAYAQSFSTDDLKLRLNSQLPPNLANWLRMAALPLEQLVTTTLPRRAPRDSVCNSSLSCLLSQLPLAMFILPGELPLLGNQLFQFSRRKSKRRERLR